MYGEGALMAVCTIAFVMLKPVSRFLQSKVFHPPVPRRFGKDGGCSDAQTALVSFDECSLRDGNFW